jgi:hypothetical protein
VELEHLTIETKLIDEMFASVLGEYVFFEGIAPLKYFLTIFFKRRRKKEGKEKPNENRRPKMSNPCQEVWDDCV